MARCAGVWSLVGKGLAVDGDAQLGHRHLLLIGINYAPEPTGIAVNTTGLAEGLVALGWQVTVLTGIPHYPWWSPRPLPPPDSNSAVRVLRRRHYVPRRQSVARRALYEASWALRSLPAMLPPRPVDAVVGVVPSLGGGVLAAAASLRYGVPYALMFQDLLGRAVSQSRYEGAQRVGGLVRRVELSLARRAAGIAVVAEGFRGYLEQGGVRADRIHRVRNPVRMGQPRAARMETRNRLGWRELETVVLHSGNMGAKQALDNVLRAAELVRGDCSLRFVLQGDGHQRQRLEQAARQSALDNVDFLPLAPEDEFPDILAAADVLLVNQGREVKDMSLPAKITCYFAVGLPIVAAVAPESETAAEVAASGAGILVPPEDPAALVAVVRELAGAPERRARLGAAGRRFASMELTAEKTVQDFHALLEAMLATRSVTGQVLTDP